MINNFIEKLFFTLIIIVVAILKNNSTKFEKEIVTPKKLNQNKAYAFNSIKVKSAHHKLLKREQEIESVEEKFEEEREKREGPDKAFEQDFNRTMNLEIKRPTPEVLPDIINENFLKLQIA
jgi:predicted Holliday junction resolvase-like endonuclease